MNVPEVVLAEMRATNAVFSREVAAGRDTRALEKVYTADARLLPPGADMVQGRAAIIAFWDQAIAALDVKEATLTTVDAEQAGDRIVEIGRADLVMGNGQPAAVKYVVVWKQEGGRWKWHIDIWNANA